MKNCKAICFLLLALVLLCSLSLAALADTPPDIIDPPALSSPQAQAEASVSVEPPPQVLDITPDSSDAEQSGPSELAPSSQPEAPEDARDQGSQEEDAPAARGSNTPYFVGAVIAVLVLIGVALYCKYNGRK